MTAAFRPWIDAMSRHGHDFPWSAHEIQHAHRALGCGMSRGWNNNWGRSESWEHGSRMCAGLGWQSESWTRERP